MRRAAPVLAGVAVVGCGLLPGVPEWVANRQPLDPCAPSPVEAESAAAAEGERCLLDAFRAGRGAELITAGRMASGGPLTSYVRVHENGTVEMFLNLGEDPHAPGAWERFRCEALVPSDVEDGHVEGAFTMEGCEQLPVP